MTNNENNDNNTFKEEDISGKAYQDQDEKSIGLKQEEKIEKEENNSPSIESVFGDREIQGAKSQTRPSADVASG